MSTERNMIIGGIPVVIMGLDDETTAAFAEGFVEYANEEFGAENVELLDDEAAAIPTMDQLARVARGFFKQDDDGQWSISKDAPQWVRDLQTDFFSDWDETRGLDNWEMGVVASALLFLDTHEVKRVCGRDGRGEDFFIKAMIDPCEEERVKWLHAQPERMEIAEERGWKWGLDENSTDAEIAAGSQRWIANSLLAMTMMFLDYNVAGAGRLPGNYGRVRL